jgi:hypothetical protein
LALLEADREIGGEATWHYVFRADADHTEAALICIDGEIEVNKVAFAAFDLQFCPDEPDLLESELRIRSNKFALFQRRRSGRNSTTSRRLPARTGRDVAI